jgi:hypothetical protein
MPMSAIMTEVTLNHSTLCFPPAILVVSLAATLRAGYLRTFSLAVEDILRDDFAAMRAIYDFLFHAFSPLAKQRKEGLCE